MSATCHYLYDLTANLNELTAYFEPELNCHDIKQRGGRGQTLLFYTADNKPLVLRHYFRGGLSGKILGDKFFICESHAHRAFDEYKLLAWMYEKGLNVPRPIIAREFNYGLYLRQDIVIEQIVDSNDLAHILSERPLTHKEWHDIGKMIGKLFALNVDHTDLNLRNILLDKQGIVYLIDFDKCFRCSLTSKRKRAILDRLLRSFNKELVVSTKKCYFEAKDFQILVDALYSI